MKKAILALSLFVGLTTAAWSAPAPAASPAPAPAATAPAGTPIKTMWDYQKELGLTDKQITDMKQAVTDLEKTVRAQQERLKPLDAQLNDQISKDAPIEQIRATLQSIAAIQIEIRLADVGTSRKINSILTADQLKKWREIQRAAREAARPR